MDQHTPQFSVRILPTHPSSQDFDWLEMTDTVSDTVRNTPLGDLLKVRISILVKLRLSSSGPKYHQQPREQPDKDPVCTKRCRAGLQGPEGEIRCVEIHLIRWKTILARLY